MLEQRTAALQGGEPRTYLVHFSEDYRDPVFPFEQGGKRLVQRFESKPWPRVSFADAKIDINGDEAVVTERISVEAMVSDRLRRYRDVQHLRLVKENGAWKIDAGSEVYRFLAGRLEEQDRIEKTLEQRAEALVHENLELYMNTVSEGYRHQGKTAEDVKQSVKESFAAFENIRYRAFDREILFFGNKATVKQRFAMEAEIMGETRSWQGNERIELERTEQGWRIIKGL